MTRRLFGVVVSFCAAACSAGGDEVPAGDAGTPAPPSDLPATDCPPGASPRVGETDCVPVGPAMCAAGFTTADSGWGCQPVAADGCSGANMRVLGSKSCAPVGDCGAAFPPKNASVVVKKGSSVSTIAAAIAKAPSGAVIAVDDGEYDEAIAPTKNVSIVGRCAAKVVINAKTAERAVYAYGAVKISLRGVTIQGGQGALIASGGEIDATDVVVTGFSAAAAIAGYSGALHLTNSLVDGGALGETPGATALGISLEKQSSAVLDGVDIRSLPAALSTYDASKASVSRSFISYDGPNEKTAVVEGYSDSVLTIDESAISTGRGGFAVVGASVPMVSSGGPAKLTMTSSSLLQTGFDRQDINFTTQDGATAELDDCSVRSEAVIAFASGHTGSKITLSRSVVLAEPTTNTDADAALATLGGAVEIDDSAIVSPLGSGLLAAHMGTTLTVQRSLIYGTQFELPGVAESIGGAGVAIAAGDAATVVLKDAALVSNQMFGVLVGEHASCDVEGTLFDGTVPPPNAPGAALLTDGTAPVSIAGSVFRGNSPVALASSSGAVLATGTIFVDNAIALAVDPSLIVNAADAPAGPPGTAVTLYQDTFYGNVLDQGSPVPFGGLSFPSF